MSRRNPFRYFETRPKIIRREVMLNVSFSKSLSSIINRLAVENVRCQSRSLRHGPRLISGKETWQDPLDIPAACGGVSLTETHRDQRSRPVSELELSWLVWQVRSSGISLIAGDSQETARI